MKNSFAQSIYYLSFHSIAFIYFFLQFRRYLSNYSQMSNKNITNLYIVTLLKLYFSTSTEILKFQIVWAVYVIFTLNRGRRSQIFKTVIFESAWAVFV